MSVNFARFGAILNLVVMLATYSHAHGETTVVRDRRKSVADEGSIALNLGRYDEAIALFELAYTQSSNPVVLFNLGLAYRLAGKPEKALLTLCSFLRTASATPSLRRYMERAGQEIELVSHIFIKNMQEKAELGKAPVEPGKKQVVATPEAVEPPSLEKTATTEKPPQTTRKQLPPVEKSIAPPPPPALDLMKKDEPPPVSQATPSRRYWLWSSLGTAVILGAATTWYYSRPSTPAPATTYGSLRVLP